MREKKHDTEVDAAPYLVRVPHLPLHYTAMAVIWGGSLCAAALFQEPVLRIFFHMLQGVVVGHVLTLILGLTK